MLHHLCYQVYIYKIWQALFSEAISDQTVVSAQD